MWTPALPSGAVKPQLLQPGWLREHRVTRVEQLSFNVEGLVWDRISYEVDADGAMQRIDED